MIFDWNKVDVSTRPEIAKHQIDWEAVELLIQWYCQRDNVPTYKRYSKPREQVAHLFQSRYTIKWTDKFGCVRWSPPMPSISQAKRSIRLIKQEERNPLSNVHK